MQDFVKRFCAIWQPGHNSTHTRTSQQLFYSRTVYYLPRVIMQLPTNRVAFVLEHWSYCDILHTRRPPDYANCRLIAHMISHPQYNKIQYSFITVAGRPLRKRHKCQRQFFASPRRRFCFRRPYTRQTDDNNTMPPVWRPRNKVSNNTCA